MVDDVAARRRGGRLRRVFWSDQREGWRSVALVLMGIAFLSIPSRRPWFVGYAVAMILFALWCVGALLWSGRRGPDGTAFWRAPPDGPVTALLVLWSVVLLTTGEPWLVATGCVFLAIGAWGLVAVVIRIVRRPDQIGS